MFKEFLTKLNSGTILLSDGAMGTELQKRGMKTGACPEELNFVSPEIIQSIHSEYYEAGSDIVETNSFGSNRIRLSLHQKEDRAYDFARKAAELAREVCPRGKFVAGSIGPTGEILSPLGPLNLQEAYDAFAEEAEALAEGGVDVIFVETMMSIEEAETAVKAAKEKTGLPVCASMTYEVGPSGPKTMWGVDVKTSIERLTEAGADVIGSNCGRGFDEMIMVMRQMRPLTEKPVLAQSNAGIPEWVNGLSVYKETPGIILPKAEELLKIGINIIGGCCGTGPHHIREIRKLADKYNEIRERKF
ncbi:MAG: 5-methyltetrahydrofolate--homocysteine methyltransferase [Ignavibacteria bacterium]|jgi:5-methyltetrahydrofolate--homocysteine methyltransferase|nr:5-methyltetrahydrofolate--homocysteine methyltransferase [Ignavibacteria bacterium]MCU7501866.1 5-methyltetrahydrofolate--homocysteine methyltransferase [Ignavibacteria bacterium]MCU7514788.1 5-methyltetrahydrofolate--homocysteine methyltransferase [Ignavibacteria bacterium]